MQSVEEGKTVSHRAQVFKCLWCGHEWGSFEGLIFWGHRGCPRCGRHTIIEVGKTVISVGGSSEQEGKT